MGFESPLPRRATGPLPAPDLVRELLRRGALRLGRPDAWLQGGQGEDAAGAGVPPEASSATAWCPLGAMRREALALCGTVHFEGPARRLYDAGMRRLAEALVEHLEVPRVSRDPATAMVGWNDGEGRTVAQVLDLFALAA